MNLVKHKPVKQALRNNVPTFYNSFRELFDLVDNYSPFDYISRVYEHPTLPRINMIDTGSDYVIEADVPGYTKDQLTVSIDGGQLTISGNKTGWVEDKTEKFLIQEKTSGTFVRTISLPKGTNADGIEASLENGILKLTVPKDQKAIEAKTIMIKG